jgi:hypothetical protein
MRVAVLGCGPAGLLAAEAAWWAGAEVAVFSQERAMSPHGGAQYLHKPIEGVTEEEPDGAVRFIKVGTREGYAEKVYGDAKAKVSWDLFDEATVPAWSMRGAYTRLWMNWAERIYEMGFGSVEEVEQRLGDFDLVFSTIPKKVLCKDPAHDFRQQDVILVPQAEVAVNNVILYNGQLAENWYRSSYLFGIGWTEYAAHAGGPPILGERHQGFKPIGNDCDCLPERIIPIGRFGRWERDVLTHHAYEDVVNELQERMT